MAYINVDISNENITLVNNVLLNEITITIDLMTIWETVKQYTHLYVGSELKIAVVAEEPQELYITISNTFNVAEVVAQKVQLKGQCPGIIDENKKPATGKANIIFYNLVTTNL